MSLIKLSGLYTYPLKSAAGIELSQTQVTTRGLLHDRRWMICDHKGKFLTQRKLPKMALIQVSIGENLCLSIRGADDEALELAAVPSEPDVLHVDVWGDSCVAWSMGNEVAQWLSDFLGCEAQLVYMPDTTHRPVDHGRFETVNSFSDAYPFLLISEASLADLNSRLEQPIPMNRFRPNLVVQGCEPFAEDTWKQIQIGEIVFDVAKACSRCSIPGVEQSTGEQGKEPLKTLATFRRWDHAIWFGQNLIAHSEGRLALSDEVTVLA
ncbi:MAG: MOSC domain-containing protein [Leptolyngbya sp. SIO3F4]|nr:MOSC domain-containing protein [Leptolyngbya sp. SIO3F4]